MKFNNDEKLTMKKMLQEQEAKLKKELKKVQALLEKFEEPVEVQDDDEISQLGEIPSKEQRVIKKKVNRKLKDGLILDTDNF